MEDRGERADGAVVVGEPGRGDGRSADAVGKISAARVAATCSTRTGASRVISPPMTTFAGFSIMVAAPTTRPSAPAASRSTRSTTGWARRTASARSSRFSRRSPNSQQAARMPGTEATVSRQPRLPQRQGRPAGSTVTCPSSPASPEEPVTSWPPTTSPPPTPSDRRT